MADFDAARIAHRLAAFRAGITGRGFAQVGILLRLKIALGYDMNKMRVLFIGARNTVGDRTNRVVGNTSVLLDPTGPANPTGEPDNSVYVVSLALTTR